MREPCCVQTRKTEKTHRNSMDRTDLSSNFANAHWKEVARVFADWELPRTRARTDRFALVDERGYTGCAVRVCPLYRSSVDLPLLAVMFGCLLLHRLQRLTRKSNTPSRPGTPTFDATRRPSGQSFHDDAQSCLCRCGYRFPCSRYRSTAAFRPLLETSRGPFAGHSAARCWSDGYTHSTHRHASGSSQFALPPVRSSLAARLLVCDAATRQATPVLRAV